MTWTISDPLREALSSAECAPVLVARFMLPPLHWLDVLDYTVGAGEFVTINNTNPDAVVQSIEEGVDFDAEISNSETARNIANAWNEADRIVNARTRAIWISGTPRVAFVVLEFDGFATSLVSSNGAAWDQVLPTQGTVDFCSMIGAMPLALIGTGATPVLSVLSGLEWSIDAVTREATPPRCDLTFADGKEIRELANLYSMRRLRVEFYLGTDDLDDFADYMQLPTLFIDDVIPKEGRVVVKLVDAAGDAWRDRTITGAWTNWHPLQMAERILELARAVDGVNYLSASLDPLVDETRSHFSLSRYDDQAVLETNSGIKEGEKAGELLTAVLSLMGGTWRPSQSGPYEFAPFDYSAFPIRSWAAAELTGHDIDVVDQETSLHDLINSYTVSFARTEDSLVREYTETDAISVIESHGVLSDYQHKSDWLNSISRTGFQIASYIHDLPHPFPGSIFEDTVEFPVEFASRQGFSGTQYSTAGASLAPGMPLGAALGRYVVLRIVGPPQVPPRSDSVNQPEYVLIDNWEIVDATPDAANLQAGPDGTTILGQDAFRARITDDPSVTLLANGFTIGEWFGTGTEPGLRTGRGILRTTTPPNWQSPTTPTNNPQKIWVEDFTIPVYVAKDIVRRFRNGAPKIKVRTNLSQIDIEVGDLISLSNDDMTITPFRGGGSHTSVVWEVCGKAIDVFSDSPSIEWELVFVRDFDLEEQVLTGILEPPPIIEVGLEPVVVDLLDGFYFDPFPGTVIDVVTDGGELYLVG